MKNFLLAFIAFVAMVFFATDLIEAIYAPSDSQIRDACIYHGGLASVDKSALSKAFVVCRDGYGKSFP